MEDLPVPANGVICTTAVDEGGEGRQEGGEGRHKGDITLTCFSHDKYVFPFSKLQTQPYTH